MEGPPPYPRIPHLLRTVAATRDDLVLDEDTRRLFLERDVVVEEKLDGASVALWLDTAGAVRAVGRSGLGGQDRGQQLGRLRAWVGERHDALGSLLADGAVLYGEWLWKRHSVRYDRLPDWFIGFDLLLSDRFLGVAERDERLRLAAVQAPPSLFRGTLGHAEKLDALAESSRVGRNAAEGTILRLIEPTADARIAKHVPDRFTRASDADLARLERNALAG